MDIRELEKELGIDDALAVEASEIRIALDKRRYGKNVTILDGFDPAVDLADVARDLRQHLGTGGTVKDHTIELQGDHRRKAREWLEKKGYRLA